MSFHHTKPSGCRYPGCQYGGKSFSRGVCISHYKMCHGLIKRGQTSWVALEAEGHVLPSLTNTKSALLLTGSGRGRVKILENALRSIVEAYAVGTIKPTSEAARIALLFASCQFKPTKP